ncbi:hypothetical protein QZH56_24350 [Streptomyces olivoreticuli]|uniref:hypothetical protein n=1 Tax=Streptomyces olivoreticuli TaxID=68246 RepID=UPI00265AA69B|nr:hypothetical protein [Streptomyces olivoreticuli]WKK21931.1 hypothetical protein QZH56_24350 [Streptomyces olivoreticuli]
MKKNARQIMEIFEALDATECVYSAAQLAGVDPKTVRRYARMRDMGLAVDAPIVRPKMIDPFMPKIEEWVERSQGRVRADKLHERLQMLGFTGDERSTRRAVAKAKERWNACWLPLKIVMGLPLTMVMSGDEESPLVGFQRAG